MVAISFIFSSRICYDFDKNKMNITLKTAPLNKELEQERMHMFPSICRDACFQGSTTLGQCFLPAYVIITFDDNNNNIINNDIHFTDKMDLSQKTLPENVKRKNTSWSLLMTNSNWNQNQVY